MNKERGSVIADCVPFASLPHLVLVRFLLFRLSSVGSFCGIVPERIKWNAVGNNTQPIHCFIQL